MKKAFRLFFILICTLLFIFTVFLAVSNLHLKRSLQELSKEKEDQIRNEVNLKARSIKKNVMKDLEEKYEADRVSYRAMVKRLELEEQKRRELEEQLDSKEEKEASE